jgi:DNA-binding beta-propeller fold protein YncE
MNYAMLAMRARPYAASIPIATEGWDITAAQFLRSFSLGAGNNFGIEFSPDGTRMYVCFSSTGEVSEFHLSTPWDVSTAAFVQSLSLTGPQETPNGDLAFSADGSRMYVIGSFGFEFLDEYSLSSPWSLSSATYVRSASKPAEYPISAGTTAVSFKSDGTRMYVTELTGDSVRQHELATAWDISTAVYSLSFSVAAQEDSPSGIAFKPDGSKLYIVGYGSDSIHEYSIATAWDVSTASYERSLSVASQDTTPTGVFFKPDGTRMYIQGGQNDAVYEYSLTP